MPAKARIDTFEIFALNGSKNKNANFFKIGLVFFIFEPNKVESKTLRQQLTIYDL